MIDGPVIEDVTATVEEQLRQHLGPQPTVFELREVDIKEERRVQDFLVTGCGCQLANGRQWFSQFSAQQFKTMRSNCAELSWDELNMCIMSQVRYNH